MLFFMQTNTSEMKRNEEKPRDLKIFAIILRYFYSVLWQLQFT